MKYKIDNKYIVEADSFRDAIKAVKRLKNAKIGDRATENDIAQMVKYLKSEYVVRPVDDQSFFYMHPYDRSDSGFVHLENGKIVFEQQGKKVAEYNSFNEYKRVGEFDDSVNDAQQIYTIRWIDTYARSKGYDKTLYRYTTEIKANDVAEALRKLSGKVVLDFGVGTANCLVVSVSTSKTTYQWSGRLSELVKKSKEDLGDSIEDADKDFIIVQLAVGNRYKVAEWPAKSAEAALKEFKEANPRWSGRQLQAIPKNEWRGTAADSVQDSVDKSINDAPDADTPSGRKQINMSIALTAVRKALPDRMWNWNGNKITIDNNRIVLVVTDDAVIWKNFKGNKDMRFTSEIALANELREALNL